MWYVLEDTVPANTAKADARETKIRVHGGILHSIIVTIPPGCSNLVHAQLKHASYFVLPRNEDQSIEGEHINVNYREWYKMQASLNTLTMVAWNDDTVYEHKVRMLLGVLPKEVMEQEENVIKSIRTFIRLFRRRT
ncbi:hypothetical protein LCGC14_0900840 [marine sediment metagenome]|uniref:Uncharacterized protein n=1 Tax=marine sediment metagenome TaxID=412755 RepID=A0A0F9P1G3_9ZZZZ